MIIVCTGAVIMYLLILRDTISGTPLYAVAVLWDTFILQMLKYQFHAVHMMNADA